jgi:hypothetical protein
MVVQNLLVKRGQILLDMLKGLKDMFIINGIPVVIVRDANLVAIVIADSDNKVIVVLPLIPDAHCRGRYNLCVFLSIIILLATILVFIIGGGHSL